jgi:competence protein ComEC
MQLRVAPSIARPAWIVSAQAGLADWADAERGRFFLWLPVLMTAGAVVFFSLRADPPAWLAPALLALSLAALAASWPRLLRRSVTAAAVAGCLGFAAAQLATWRTPPLLEVPARAVVAEGTVRSVEPLPEGRRVTLKAARLDGGTPLARLLRIRLRASDATPVAAGDALRLRALLMRPAPPAYPGAWDLQRDAFYEGFGAFGTALGPATRLAAGGPSRLAGLLQRLRETVAARVAAVLDGSTAAIATTMLTGATSAIPEADRRAFRDSGLAHLLAVAGLHIGIVMGLFFGATRLALAVWEWAALHWPTKKIAALVALLAAAGYMLLTGAHVPVQRSFAMACLFTLGVVAGRRALSLRGLALAMAALVLLEPHQVMDVSFQMSLSAVLALIVGYDALRPWLMRLRGEGSWRGRLGSYVAALAATSALAGTFSAPFAAAHFGQVQLYNVLANMVAVPLTALLVMPSGLLALALMPAGAEAVALVPMGWGVDAVLWVARSVSAWPAATVMVPHMPAWGIAVVGIGLAWAGLWRTRLRLAGWALVAAGLASPAFERPPDLLMSADGRMVGLRADDGMYVQTAGSAARFTLESWQVLWQARLVQPLGCGRAPCELRARPDDKMALLVRGDPPESACAAAVVLSLEPVRLPCAGPVPVVDRFSVWREGAYAIWLAPDGARLLSDRAARGERLWMPRPNPRSRLPAGVVPAPAEELPAE